MAPQRADGAAGAYRTKADFARQHIQGLILSGAARAGDHITTREVSEALGMSETPVREAIRGLAAEGWLDLHAHVGCVVASLNIGQLAEIYAIRGALGATAIALGGAHYSAVQLAALDRNLVAAEDAAAREDVVAYTALNREFHVLLSDTPNTQWTLKLLTTLWAQTAAFGRGFALNPASIHRSFREHREIMQAVRAQDFVLAAAALVAHERRAGEQHLAALAAILPTPAARPRPAPKPARPANW